MIIYKPKAIERRRKLIQEWMDYLIKCNINYQLEAHYFNKDIKAMENAMKSKRILSQKTPFGIGDDLWYMGFKRSEIINNWNK